MKYIRKNFKSGKVSYKYTSSLGFNTVKSHVVALVYKCKSECRSLVPIFNANQRCLVASQVLKPVPDRSYDKLNFTFNEEN